MRSPYDTKPTHIDDALAAILKDLRGLQDALTDAELLWAAQIEQADRRNSSSAVNLAHCWAVRRHDLRVL